METFVLKIGEWGVNRNGGSFSDTREVEFTGELLGEASDREPEGNRGTTWQLYRTEDARMVVHTHQWSRWQGEPDTASVELVTDDDLGFDGRFWRVGENAGFGRPLTLDEALRLQETGDIDKPIGYGR